MSNNFGQALAEALGIDASKAMSISVIASVEEPPMVEVIYCPDITDQARLVAVLKAYDLVERDEETL